MYNIKISLPHKTMNHTCLTLPKAYTIIMNSYYHLKQSKEEVFSILLWDKQGKLLRLTNKHLLGVHDIQKEYINYKLTH